MRNVEAITLLAELIHRDPTMTPFDLAHAAYAELDPYDEAPPEVKTLARTQLFFLAKHVCVSRVRLGDVVLQKAAEHVKRGLQ